ncbi:MAG TPA: hypothetical protein VFC53_00625 [Dehalococcoidia bacterium]|jgi:hypothetical protein|nr:hypothetical protein [Dehalococcoidia bacterium]
MERRPLDQRIIRYGSHIADRLPLNDKGRRYPVQVRSTFVRLTRKSSGHAA